MKPRSASAKGKELEKHVQHRLRVTGLDTGAYRTPGSGSGYDKGDVGNSLNLAIECKNTKAFHAAAFWKQARREAVGDYARPVLVWHPPQTPLDDSLVMIEWSHFEELLLKSKQPRTENPDRDFRYKLERLKQLCGDLIKRL